MLDSLTLTDKEVAYVRNETEKMKTLKWEDDLFPNSKVISTDSIAFFQNEYRKLLAARDYKLAIKTKEKSISWHNFSNPIFLRGDTYCLFYKSEHYSSNRASGEGSGGFSVYKKEKGKWLYWCSISYWMT
jgi:hypothetical protein